jgi:oligo-1,6-glucosidase
MLLAHSEEIYAFVRRWHDTALLIVASVSGEEQELPVDDLAGWDGAELVLGTYPATAPDATSPLRPWEARVHRTVTAGIPAAADAVRP